MYYPCPVCRRILPKAFINDVPEGEEAYGYGCCSPECARTMALVEAQRENTHKLLQTMEWLKNGV